MKVSLSGQIVPSWLTEDMVKGLRAESPYPKPAPFPKVRLTIRRRIAMVVGDVRYALARRLYPYAFEQDDD